MHVDMKSGKEDTWTMLGDTKGWRIDRTHPLLEQNITASAVNHSRNSSRLNGIQSVYSSSPPDWIQRMQCS